MSSVLQSRSLALLTGLGMTFALAAGSVYFLIYTSGRERYHFRKKKPIGLTGEESPQRPIIKILKEVPLIIFEQTNGFSTIKEDLGTLVDIQGFLLHDMNGSNGSQPFVPETVNNYYKYVQIEGYREDALNVSRAIDCLIKASGSNNFQIFEIRSNQVKSIIGHQNSISRGIEKESGAKLVIGEYDDHRSSFSTIQIIGTEQQICEAYKLLDLHLSKDNRYQNRNVPIQAVPEGNESADSDEEFIREQMKKTTIVKAEAPVMKKASGTAKDMEDGAPKNSGLLRPTQGDVYIKFDGIERTLSSYTSKLEIISSTASTDLYSLILPKKVFVSHILSPDHFYLQINDTRSYQLEHLEDDIKEFLDSKDNRQSCRYTARELHDDYAKLVGDIVACPVYFEHKPKYIRACVMRLVPAKEAPLELPALANGMPFFQLFCVDYGMTEVRRLDEFFVLNDCYVNCLEFQGIKCRLRGVAPVEGQKWPTKVVEMMKKVTYEAMWIDVTSTFCFGFDRQTRSCEVDLICRDPQKDTDRSNPFYTTKQRSGGSTFTGGASNFKKSCGHKPLGQQANRTFKLAEELIRLGHARPVDVTTSIVNSDESTPNSRETSSPEMINAEECTEAVVVEEKKVG